MSAPEAQERWPGPEDLALLTDLYQLTMLQGYHREGMEGEAVFSLYFRTLPPGRGYAVACGLDGALAYLETVRFTDDALAYLGTLGTFGDGFLAWLADFRFEGDVHAIPEGTPVFPDEPILEVTAPIAQAQLAESFVLNQVHHQTVMASKAARVVHAAGGRTVSDFGFRRMHGTTAALQAARAFHVAGVDSTSNVLAGKVYGLAVAGTMAHSYIEAHDSENQAFEAFAELYPDATLLVDTYDTERGVERAAALARRLREGGTGDEIRAIRLDSGDLGALAFRAREILDGAGLSDIRIFASGGLDEAKIAHLVASGAPIDGFGVGTRMGTSSDVPTLDMVYKLVAYDGRGRMKLSTSKKTLPGPKQVFRRVRDGEAAGDRIGRRDEAPRDDETPLLEQVMAGGERTDAGRVSVDAARRHARAARETLPASVRALDTRPDSYPVVVSEHLAADRDALAEELRRA